MSTERYWRIRGRDATRTDRVGEAWERGEVGIWYGGWSADDWYAAVASSPADPATYLNGLPHQLWPVPRRFVDTARRFAAISSDDWVVTCHGGRILLGRIDGPMRSKAAHPLNCGPEPFKYRRVVGTKAFHLSLLPDSFRLLPPAGRGNVHQFRDTNRRLVALLARSRSEDEVVSALGGMQTTDWLDLLGPAEWESLCLGYLILEDDYLPTGLAPGRTLPALDIVGVSARDGRKILAQCKKGLRPVDVHPTFVKAVGELEAARAYYFAYSGCRDAPAWVRVVTRDDMLTWLGSERGRVYLRLWRAAPGS